MLSDGKRRRPVTRSPCLTRDTVAPAVARALVGGGSDILSLAESRHSLEDVYLESIDEDVEVSRR